MDEKGRVTGRFTCKANIVDYEVHNHVSEVSATLRQYLAVEMTA